KVGLAFAGLTLFFLIVLGAGIGWVWRDHGLRQELQEREAGVALRQAEALLEQDRRREADAWARRARLVLGDGEAPGDLRRRLEELLADLRMVDRLDEIRMLRSN